MIVSIASSDASAGCRSETHWLAWVRRRFAIGRKHPDLSCNVDLSSQPTSSIHSRMCSFVHGAEQID